MASNIEHITQHSIMTRYYSDNIYQDNSIDELYNILYDLTQDKLYELNDNNNMLTTKQMLVANYIAKSIEKFYNYIREIQASQRKITDLRKTQIVCEKTYWKDIASGTSENKAKEILEICNS